MKDPSKEFIDQICQLYGDVYDDREEDSAPGGLDWEPGKTAQHKSLAAFKRELEEVHDIKLSSSKLLKILITGGCWTTERTREVGVLYETLTSPGADGGIEKEAAVKRIAEELEISPTMVYMSLPYNRVVYDVPGKTSNAVRCDRARRKRSASNVQDSVVVSEKNRRETTMILADVNNQEGAKLFFDEFHIPYEVTQRGENKGMLRIRPIRAIDRKNLMEARSRLEAAGLGFLIDHTNCFRDEEDNTVCTFSPYHDYAIPDGLKWLKVSRHSIYGMGTDTYVVVQQAD